MTSNIQKRVESLPLLYRELADWWSLLSPPEDYAEESAFYQRTLISACPVPPQTLLELGSGGGNNASHLKKKFQMTLVDLSPFMLKVSWELNPDCEHVHGDMRSVRLERLFDAVFIQDAISYMLTSDDLAKAVETAFVHCRPGGAALFAPDHTRETFKPSTDHGGRDGANRSLRYLEWTWKPDNSHDMYFCDMVYVLREGMDEARCFYDRHICGLFSSAEWLQTISRAGFEARALPFEHSSLEPGSMSVFLGLKPV